MVGTHRFSTGLSVFADSIAGKLLQERFSSWTSNQGVVPGFLRRLKISFSSWSSRHSGAAFWNRFGEGCSSHVQSNHCVLWNGEIRFCETVSANECNGEKEGELGYKNVKLEWRLAIRRTSKFSFWITWIFDKVSIVTERLWEVDGASSS